MTATGSRKCACGGILSGPDQTHTQTACSGSTSIGPMAYGLTQPPLTEERVRQIVRDEVERSLVREREAFRRRSIP